MKESLIKVACLVHTHHRRILVSSIIAAIILVSLIFNIRMKADLMDVFPADNPSMKLFAETIDDLQGMNALTVVIDSGGSDIELHTGLIELMAQRLAESPLVKSVNYSFFNVPWEFMFRFFPLYIDETGLDKLGEKLTGDGIDRRIRDNYKELASFLSTPADIRMITEDPLDIRSLMKSSVLKAEAAGIDFSSGYYFSKDRTKAFIFAVPDGSNRDFSFVGRLKTEMNKAADGSLNAYGNPEGVSIEFTGGHAISWEAQEGMRRDMLFSVLITAVLVLLIFRIIYKGSFTLFFIIFFTILMALLVTLASAYFLFGGLNLITAVVSAMLIGLGFDYTLHISDRYVMEYKNHGNALQALQTTFSNTGKSVITSAVTTSFAFFSIVVTSFKGLHELGIIAGIGILACMVSSLFVMGSLLIWSSERGMKGVCSQRDNYFLEKAAPDFLFRHGKLFLIFLCAAVLLFSLGLPKLKFTSDVSRIGLKNSRAMELQKGLSEIFADKGVPLIVTYSGEKPFDEINDILERQLAQWKDRGTVGGFMSLSEILPPVYRQRVVIEKLRNIRVDRDDIKRMFFSALNRYGFTVKDNYLPYINSVVSALEITQPLRPRDLPDAVRGKAAMFYNPGKNRLAAYLYPVNKQWDENHISALKDGLSRMGEGWNLTGWDLLRNDLKTSIIKESITASLISLGFILAMLFIHFRKPSVIFLVQLPLLFGLLLTLGIMGFTNTGFNYINISAVAMIFGISVDYGVYFMQTFIESGKGRDRRLIRHAFKNIVVCSLTTMAGFGSLVTANFRGISSLGLVVIIGITSCLIMSTALLPLSGYFLKGEQ